jgi:hypothetical protein
MAVLTEAEVRALRTAQGTELANLKETVLSLLSQLREPERVNPTRELVCRPKVLVVAHGDGYLEVTGPRNVDVRIVNVPQVPKTTDGEKFVEEFIKCSGPRCYLNQPFRQGGFSERMSMDEWKWMQVKKDSFALLKMLRGIPRTEDIPQQPNRQLT